MVGRAWPVPLRRIFLGAAPAQTVASKRSCIVNAISTAMVSTEDQGKKDLDTLFRAHYGRIARVIGRLVRDQARAEELAVDVFIKWRRNGGESGDVSEGWLYRTAVRGAIDEWRRQTRRERFETLFAAFRRSPPTPLEICEADATQRSVRTVLGSIEPRHAQALLLWGEELSYQEIAAAMELNVTSVGSLLIRAQGTFRKEYEKRYGSTR